MFTRTIRLFSAGLLLSLFFSQCKEPEIMGIGPTDGQDLFVSVTDTFTIEAHTFEEEELPTDNSGKAMTGSCEDPVFGESSAGFYTQFLLPSPGNPFEEDAVLDSVILSLAYDDFYGDSSSLQTVKVYQMTESLLSDTTYYASSAINYDSDPIATVSFTPEPNTSYYDSIHEETLSPHLRIKLDEHFGNTLLAADDGHFNDNESFLDFFKGLYINAGPADGQGGIITFNLLSSLSGLTIYYHTTDNDTTSSSFTLETGEDAVHFNTFTHDYTSAVTKLQQQVIHNDTTAGDSVLFIQAMNSLRVQVAIPHLDKLSNTNRTTYALYKAELIVNTENTSDTYLPPERLYIFSGANGSLSYITDYSGSNVYNAQPYEEDNTSYRFLITQYIQNILTGDGENHNLVLMAANNTITANRAVLKGPDRSSDNMKLVLTFTKTN